MVWGREQTSLYFNQCWSRYVTPYGVTRPRWVQLYASTLADPRSLHWRYNDHGGVSNHQPHGCLLNRFISPRSNKTSMLCVSGLCAGNSPGPVNSPHKGASNAENCSIWWRHYVFQWRHMNDIILPVILLSIARCFVKITSVIFIPLIHFGLVAPYGVIEVGQHWGRSTLVQVMACCLMVPGHYLNHCWLVNSKLQ